MKTVPSSPSQTYPLCCYNGALVSLLNNQSQVHVPSSTGNWRKNADGTIFYSTYRGFRPVLIFVGKTKSYSIYSYDYFVRHQPS